MLGVVCFVSGRCGHESPCEQLCYELHDGMFECDCRQGFTLHQDGYSCTGHFLLSNSCLAVCCTLTIFPIFKSNVIYIYFQFLNPIFFCFNVVVFFPDTFKILSSIVNAACHVSYRTQQKDLNIPFVRRFAIARF